MFDRISIAGGLLGVGWGGGGDGALLLLAALMLMIGWTMALLGLNFLVKLLLCYLLFIVSLYISFFGRFKWVCFQLIL